jgi:hypothetical protein
VDFAEHLGDGVLEGGRRLLLIAVGVGPVVQERDGDRRVAQIIWPAIARQWKPFQSIEPPFM